MEFPNVPEFSVKICGITTVDDALMVADAGADAIGLNFYPRSPRYVAMSDAVAIVRALPPTVVRVGLFVNAASEDVCCSFDTLGLDLIQLHGDEPPSFLSQLGPRPVMKAFRIGPSGLAPVREFLDECGRLGCRPRFVLLDALVTGAYGGTGKLADWSAAQEYRHDDSLPPMVLAGGLTPTNVAEAIRSTGTRAVDTASGVESSPGRKDSEAVKAFVRSAKAAWA